MSHVAVVIPVFNYPQVARCLDCVLNQDYHNYSIIVVDDGSTDETLDVLLPYRDRGVRILRQDRGGAAAARNTGARCADSDFILFLDSDTEVRPDFVRNMVKPLDLDQTIGMTHALYGIANPDSLVARLIYYKCDYVFRNLDEMDFAWSFGIALRRQVFADIGMFDREFPGAGSEDIDFAYRLNDAGYKIKLVRDAVVRHHFHETLQKHIRRHIAQARLRMMLLKKTKKYTDQQAGIGQYLNLIFHGLFWLTLPFCGWLPELPLTMLLVALLFHVPLTHWVIKETGDWQYALFLPFEFITITSWVLGSVEGAWELLQRRHGHDTRFADVPEVHEVE